MVQQQPQQLHTPTPEERPAQLARWPWKLFFAFLALYVLTSRGHTGSIDEESLLYASSRIVHAALGMFNVAWPLQEPSPGVFNLFTTYEPAQPVLAVPFYLVGSLVASFFPLESQTYVTRLIVTLFGAVVSAATVARLYQVGRTLGQASAAATFMAITYGVGTLAWPYARTFFREPLTAFALVSGAYAMLCLQEGGNWRQAAVSWGWVLLGVMTKLAAVFTVPIFAVYFARIYLPRRRSDHGPSETQAGAKWHSGWVMAAAAGVLIIVLAGIVFQDRWKQIGPYLSQIGLFTGDFSYVGTALYGLTLSPGKGLLVFAPPVLAGLAGLYLLFWQRSAEALLIAVLALVFIFVYSLNPSWHGGATWGPRYLLPVLP
ncbi:MAG: hypothetical protein M3328_01550, partial [Chloroflexota bacterium]|nr:hypothetical protein [Chloroflexota bacterium]